MLGKKKKETLIAPFEGKLIPTSEIPDEVFSEDMLGEGFGVIPVSNKLISPVDGVISVFYKTKHAIVIETPNKLEILIHVGLDTVSMDGKPFTSHVKEGDKVKQGDVLLEVDFDAIDAAGLSRITPIVITNMEIVTNIDLNLNNPNGVAVVTL